MKTAHNRPCLAVIIQLLFNVLVSCSPLTFFEDETIVATNYGKVKGGTMLSRKNRVFHAFKGIPYAAPPVGNLRFSAPTEPNRWDDIKECYEDKPMCIQKNYLFNVDPTVEGDEDCLYLNIYTPKLGSQKDYKDYITDPNALPVMVFIHYGGFFAGTGNSDYIGPEYFMDTDIILVTFNYRLGVFGFLSTNDDIAPGNWGLKDQVAALKWVQENIHAFGGNRKKVTIFGQSAGAASVHYHLLSHATKNLFQGAISQSGSVLSLWARPHNEQQVVVTQMQALFVGCDNYTQSSDTINCLRQINAVTLADSISAFKTFASEPIVIYGPVIEKRTKLNPNPYITDDPLHLIEIGSFHKVPWIIGVVSDEGILRAAPLLRQIQSQETLNSGLDTIAPSILGLPLSVTNSSFINETWEQISDHFYIHSTVDVENIESVQGFIDLYGDRTIVYGSYQSALLHAYKGHTPIWFYNFAYKGQFTYGDYFAATKENINFNWGVSHCDDLLYLFPSTKLFDPLTNKDDIYMSEIMVEMWVHFATYGYPKAECEESDIFIPEWKPLKNLEKELIARNLDLWYLNITGPYHAKDEQPTIKFEMDNSFYSSRMEFWNCLNLSERVPTVQ